MNAKVMVVAHESGVSLPLRCTLEREGYVVSWAEPGPGLPARVQADGIDCMLLDLPLSRAQGCAVSRALRESGYAGGIVVMNERCDEVDVVFALDSGADDHVSKPVPVAELQARLRAVLRRSGGFGATGARGADTPAAAEGGSQLRLDADAHRVFVGEAEVKLSNKQFGVLRLLSDHRGKVVPRARLIAEVWDEQWFGSTKTLDVTLGRLRAKLLEAGSVDQIVAVRGVGFRLEHERSA